MIDLKLRIEKQEVCDSLLETLRKTRLAEEFEYLEFEEALGEEFVLIHRKNKPIIRVLVTADSGIALITDIMKAINKAYR